VKGQGVGGLREPPAALDFGNSGTGSRLMLGVVAGHDMQVEFTGDASLRRRPMGRVLAPLAAMGLQTDADEDHATLPLVVRGTCDLLPIVYDLPVPSAQVKSAVLLAGLHAPGRTTVVEPVAARDHTERMLTYFGAEISVEDRGAGARAVTVCGDAELHGASIAVPGDPSSAAFMIAASLISPGSDIVVEGVLLNPTRSGFIETLREMGATIEVLDRRNEGGEPVGDLRVRASALKGVRVPPDRAPSMIDEYPVLACLAAFAEGETRMPTRLTARAMHSSYEMYLPSGTPGPSYMTSCVMVTSSAAVPETCTVSVSEGRYFCVSYGLMYRVGLPSATDCVGLNG